MKWSTRLFFLLALLATLGYAPAGLAVTCTSIATNGNWNAPATWTGCTGGNGTVANTPGPADTAIIATTAGNAVTVNVAVTVGAVIVNAGATLTQTQSLILSTATLSGTLDVAGTLTSNNTLTIGGPTNITAGTFSPASISTRTYIGPVTISGGTWAGTTRAAIFRGGLTVNGGTFTAGTGLHTFNTNNQNIGGASAISIPSITITGVTLTNTGTLTIATAVAGAGTLLNDTNATLNIGDAAIAGATTLTATATGNTVNYNLAGVQTVKPTAYYHLILSNTSAKTMTNVTVIGGDLTISNTATMTGNAAFTVAGTLNYSSTGTTTLTAATAISIGKFNQTAGTFVDNGNTITVTGTGAGTWSKTGTFTATGTVIFTGAAPQIGASNFSNLTIDVGSGNTAALTGNATVSGVLALTSGVIATGTNTMITTAACPASVTRTGGHVAGFLQKRFPAAAPSNCTFEVGDATTYRPIDMAFASVTTAGNLVGSVTQTAGSHPNIASSGIDAAQDVNRYWTVSNPGGIAFTNYNATFNFVAADIDSGANPANFTVERWDGSAWSAMTLASACTTVLCQITGATLFGDFAIGEGVPVVGGSFGDYNIFESDTPVGINGKIYTKLVGTDITVDVVRLNNARTGVRTGYSTAALVVDLMDARDNTGAEVGTTGCRASWAVLGSVTITTSAWVSGRHRITIPLSINANAGRNVRIRVTQSTGATPPRGCSKDNFAIRPAAFTGITTNMTNATSSGTPSLKTGQNFTFSAVTGLTGYDQGSGATDALPAIIPLVDNTKVTGSPNAGTVGGAFGAAAGGTATGSAFFYSEVGNLSLGINGVYDNVFTNVDQPNDCTDDFSNNLVPALPALGGKYGCKFGNSSATATFGRFIPDNFAVSLNTPQLGSACGTFGYVGQLFSYTAAPVITVTARNGTTNGLTNATTTNYAGSYMKFSNAAGTSLNQAPYDTQAGRYTRFDALAPAATPALDVSALPLTTADPAIGALTSGDFINGVGTLTFSSGGGLVFTRPTMLETAPFNADIALTLNIVDTDGVTPASNPVSFGAATLNNGITFSNGKGMLFGRLRLSNAHGSELLRLPVPLEAQYWNGTAFVTSTADNCTTIAPVNITMDDYKKTLAACETAVSGGGTLVAGRTTLRLSVPGAGNTGSVRLRANLGTAAGNTCLASPGAEAPAATANQSYLRGKSGATYDNDPAIRATFGVYKGGPVIYMREMY